MSTPPLLGELPQDVAAASLTLARRFAAGATMWCASPAWPHHARHVAVEFVHPVIVGKRALPALAVPGPDPVPPLRTSARPGDVLVGVGGADEPALAQAMRRAQAWGVTTVWIGAGRRPPAGAADHVLWLDEGEELAAFDGRFILLYHLLWELTHVCFEHPGLLRPEACDGPTCVTCADEGRLAEVVAGGDAEVVVRTPVGREVVDATVVGPVAAGDLVLVHAGTLVARVEGEGTR